MDLDLKVVLRLFFSKQNNYHMKSQHTFYLYIIALISLKKNCVKHSSCYLHSMSIEFEFRGRSSIWYGLRYVAFAPRKLKCILFFSVTS